MAKPPRGNDLINLLRGLTKVGSAVAEIRAEEVRQSWAASPIRPLVEGSSQTIQDAIVKAVAQPSTLQDVAKQGASEVAGRLSMVTAGIRAWSFDPKVSGMPEKVDEAYDPLLDPNVEQVYADGIDIKESTGDTGIGAGTDGLDFGTAMIEENLSMQSSSSAALENLDALATKGTEAFAVAQELAHSVQGQVEAAVDHQLAQFESLLDPEQKEVEITEEHLDALGDKLSEIRDIAYGHDLKIFKEVEPAKPVEEALTDLIKEQEILGDRMKGEGTGSLAFGTSLIEENLGMQASSAAALENLDVLASEGIEEVSASQEVQGQVEAAGKKMKGEITGGLAFGASMVEENLGMQASSAAALENLDVLAFKNNEGASATQEDQVQMEAAVDQRLAQFESLVDCEQQEVEITEEYMDAINAKLSEVQDIAYGHDLKIFKEVENFKPVGVFEEKVKEQSLVIEVKDEVVHREQKESLSVQEITTHLAVENNVTTHSSKEVTSKVDTRKDNDLKGTNEKIAEVDSLDEEPVPSKGDHSAVESIHSESNSNLDLNTKEEMKTEFNMSSAESTRVDSSEIPDNVQKMTFIDSRSTQTLNSLETLESLRTNQQLAHSLASIWGEAMSTPSQDLVQKPLEDLHTTQHLGFIATAKPAVTQHSVPDEASSETVSETSVGMTGTMKGTTTTEAVQDTGGVKVIGSITDIENVNITAAESVKETGIAETFQETTVTKTVRETSGITADTETTGTYSLEETKLAEDVRETAPKSFKEGLTAENVEETVAVETVKEERTEGAVKEVTIKALQESTAGRAVKEVTTEAVKGTSVAAVVSEGKSVEIPNEPAAAEAAMEVTAKAVKADKEAFVAEAPSETPIVKAAIEATAAETVREKVVTITAKEAEAAQETAATQPAKEAEVAREEAAVQAAKEAEAAREIEAAQAAKKSRSYRRSRSCYGSSSCSGC